MKRLCWNRKVFGVIPQPSRAPWALQFVNADVWLCTNTHVAEALEIWKAMVAGSQVCFPLSPLSTAFPSFCVQFIAKE